MWKAIKNAPGVWLRQLYSSRILSSRRLISSNSIWSICRSIIIHWEWRIFQFIFNIFRTCFFCLCVWKTPPMLFVVSAYIFGTFLPEPIFRFASIYFHKIHFTDAQSHRREICHSITLRKVRLMVTVEIQMNEKNICTMKQTKKNVIAIFMLTSLFLFTFVVQQHSATWKILFHTQIHPYARSCFPIALDVYPYYRDWRYV